MLSSFTPYFSIGTIKSLPSFFTAYGRSSSTSNIFGIEGPKISVSSSPTLYPSRASAMARLADTVLLPTPPLPLLTAMMFFTPGSIWPTSGRGALLNSVFISTSTSFPQWYLIAASAALTVDFRNGSVSRGNSSTTVTFQGSPSFCGAATAGVSATIPLSTTFFLVPAYVTVAKASITIFGYITFSIFFILLYPANCALSASSFDSHPALSPPQALPARLFVAGSTSYILCSVLVLSTCSRSMSG